MTEQWAPALLLILSTDKLFNATYSHMKKKVHPVNSFLDVFEQKKRKITLSLMYQCCEHTKKLHTPFPLSPYDVLKVK